MSEVENNTKVKAAASSLQIAQLEQLEQKLHGELEKRKQSLSQTGIVHDITTDTQVQTIQKALSQVQEARAQADPRIDQKIANHLARAGKPTSVEHEEHQAISGDFINAREAAQIKAIRAVDGMELSRGQQFTSLQGKEPSYNSYMKKNIEGLFALTALRA